MLNLFDVEAHVAERSKEVERQVEHARLVRLLSAKDGRTRPSSLRTRIATYLSAFRRRMEERPQTNAVPGSTAIRVYCVCPGEDCACARSG